MITTKTMKRKNIDLELFTIVYCVKIKLSDFSATGHWHCIPLANAVAPLVYFHQWTMDIHN